LLGISSARCSFQLEEDELRNTEKDFQMITLNSTPIGSDNDQYILKVGIGKVEDIWICAFEDIKFSHTENK
jgi:hypothetical protein